MKTTRNLFVLLFALLSARPADAAVHRIFVTSVAGNGNLGSWPDAGAATGLAAGDAICRARAAAAGLPDPASFVAFLSDSVDDAYCRAHGFTGKKSANCGQPTLPTDAGPWRRVGGTPFGPGLPSLLDPFFAAILPPRIDETGATVHVSYWTGTEVNGAVQGAGFHCGNWGSTSGFGTSGMSDTVGGSWINIGGSGCSVTDHHLLCLQPGAGDPLSPFANWGRLAFVTSAAGSGNLSSWPEAGGQSGLAAGDAICTQLATAAGLPEPASFKAWLSTGTVDARDRFVNDGPWMRLDRARLAADLTDLTDGLLNTGLDLDENGVIVAATAVWTGTSVSGTADTDRCSDWASASASAMGDGGMTEYAEAHWTAFVSRTCDTATNRLYCLQDLPLVFGDGFESGNTAAWSVAVP